MKKLEDSLPTKLKSSSLISKLNRVNQQILLAKESDEGVLGKMEFKKLVVRVVAMHGIKELPSKEIMALCYDSWLSKFSLQMKVQELHLAFEMNVNGDFNIKEKGEVVSRKVNHYQCFSREFFCDVLNQYLSERDAVSYTHLTLPTKRIV